MTKCCPSKKSLEYSGYDAIARKPGNGAKVVAVHSHPFRRECSTPQALKEIPRGSCRPVRKYQLVESNTPSDGVVGPGKTPFALGRPVGGALELASRLRQACAAPAAVRRRFRIANVHRPAQRQRHSVEHRPPRPHAVLALPGEEAG